MIFKAFFTEIFRFLIFSTISAKSIFSAVENDIRGIDATLPIVVIIPRARMDFNM